MRYWITILAVAGLLDGACVCLGQGQVPSAPGPAGVPGEYYPYSQSEFPVGTVLCPGIYIKPSGIYFDERREGVAMLVRPRNYRWPEMENTLIDRPSIGIGR